MFIFEDSLTYLVGPTSEDRERIAQITTTEKTRKTLKIVNYAANIAVPLIVLLLTRCNLILTAIAFVLTDIVLYTVDYYVIAIKPHQQIRSGLLSEAKKNFQATLDRREELNDKIDEFVNSSSKNKNGTFDEYCDWKEELRNLETFIAYESDWMEKKLIPFKEDEIKSLQKPVKDYTDKRLYFASMEEKIKSYVAKYDLGCLKPVIKSINSLMETLDNRQDGYEMVPSMLYIYINELDKVLSKISSLKKAQMKEHMQDLTKVSNALSQNIDRLVDRINNTEAEDIDISLSVLLQELEGEGIV